jgi:hypothetical protein
MSVNILVSEAKFKNSSILKIKFITNNVDHEEQPCYMQYSQIGLIS